MVLIIDPQNAGISGNMVVGAFIDLGADSKEIKELMESVAIDFGGVNVSINKINKSGIKSTYVDVEQLNSDNPYHHNIGNVNKNESHDSISYKEFLNKINNLANEKEDLLNNEILNISKNVFEKIATAESKIHGKSLDEVHFHEVGAADAVADVIGSIYGYFQLELNREKIIGLPVALGGGTIDSIHGRIPIPSPATTEILNGVSCFGGPIKTELATPTGSALFLEICNEFNEFLPMLKPQKIAYGAGKKEFNFPNVLRLIKGKENIGIQKIDVLETNIDHLSGETLGYLFDKLMTEGALDVAIVPIIMKKNRPGQLLKVICKKKNTENLTSAIFSETGTLGIRISSKTHRGVANRKIISLNVDINGIKSIRFKIGLIGNEIISARPEYEDIRKIASEANLPLNEVSEVATFEFKKYLDSNEI